MIIIPKFFNVCAKVGQIFGPLPHWRSLISMGFLMTGYAPIIQATPLSLKADRIEYQKNNALCLATGSVRLETKGQPLYVLTTDSLVAHLDAHKKLTLVEAKGNILITQGDLVAQAQEGTYIPQTHQMTLRGKVTITDPQHQMEGDEATLNLQTKACEIKRHPSSPQVMILFTPKSRAKGASK